MTEIHSINLNTPNIANPSVSDDKAKKETTEERVVETEVKSEKPQVSEKDLFSFMANGAMISRVNVKLSPAALVAKYNTPEQVASIEASVIAADKAVDNEEMSLLDAEFGDIPAYQNMSEANKRTLALESRMERIEGNLVASQAGTAIGNMFDGLTDSVVEGLAGF